MQLNYMPVLRLINPIAVETVYRCIPRPIGELTMCFVVGITDYELFLSLFFFNDLTCGFWLSIKYSTISDKYMSGLVA